MLKWFRNLFSSQQLTPTQHSVPVTPTSVVVVTNENADQALYVNGELRVAATTIYASFICHEVKGQSMTLRSMRPTEFVHPWPQQLCEVPE